MEQKRWEKMNSLEQWLQHLSYYGSKMETAKIWNELCEEIRKTGKLQNDSSFARLIAWIVEHSKHPVKKGTKFYRARFINIDEIKRSEALADYPHGLTGVWGFDAKGSGISPTPEAGRINRDGEPVLYLSSSSAKGIYTYFR